MVKVQSQIFLDASLFMMPSLKIRSIQPYLMPVDSQPDGWCLLRPNILVRLETHDGLVGWGECYVSVGHDDAICSLVTELGKRVRDLTAFNIRHFTKMALAEFSNYFVSMDVASATSGIELAMWDAVGQALSVPVHNMLGGASRSDIPLYANMWTERYWSDADTAAKAKDYVAQGFQTVKFYPMWHTKTDAECISRVEAVRDAIGPDVGLAIDFVRRAQPDQIKRICRALEAANLAWVEDPVPPYQTNELKWIREQISQPLLAGESVGYTHGFQDIFSRSALDIINPDVCLTGGLLEMLEISSMAAANMVKVSPHNYNSSTVGLSATAAIAATISNLAPVEYFPEHATKLDHVCTGRLEAKDGRLPLPTAPGWGLTFDEDLMKEFAWGR